MASRKISIAQSQSSIGACQSTFIVLYELIPAAIKSKLTGAELAELVDLLYRQKERGADQMYRELASPRYKIPYPLYHRLFERASDCRSVDEFLADSDLLDIYGEDTDHLVEALLAIWGVATGGAKYIRARCGLTQDQLSRYTQIPKRTIESWDAGDRCPTDYLLTSLSVMLGIYPFDLSVVSCRGNA